MSLALINKKFDELNKKEKEIHDYFDPINIHKNQHPNIKDLRDDYNDDFKNYGFNRFQLKENQHDLDEVSKNQPSQQSIDLYDHSNNIKKANNNIRPKTAKNSNNKLSKIRPTTAFPQKNNFTQSQQQNQQQQQQVQQQRPYTAQQQYQSLQSQQNKGDKYWKNTVKFEKQKNQKIRNSSALNKIIIDLDENQYQMAGDINMVHQHVISSRLNDQKIYIDRTGTAHNFVRDLDMFAPRKQSPSEKDKEYNRKAFNEAKQFVSEKQQKKQFLQGIGSPKMKQRPKNESIKSNNSTQQQNNNNFINSKNISKNNSVIPEESFNIKNNSSYQLHKEKQRIKDNNTLEENEYKVINNSQNKAKIMTRVKNLVMKLDPNEDHVFVDNSNQAIPPLVETNWKQLKRDINHDFEMLVIDLKTMNYIHMDKISIENEKLVNTKLQDLARYINFKRIMDNLYLESDHTEDGLISKPFFYILFFQTAEGREYVLFEKFFFQGYLQSPLEKHIIDLLMVFYLRFLMIYDPQSQDNIEDIMKNTLFIIQRKQNIPPTLRLIIQKLKEKVFFLEDLSKQTKRYNIFPLIEKEMLKKPNQPRNYYDYNLLSKEEDQMIEEKMQLQQTSFSSNLNNFQSQSTRNIKNNLRPQTAKQRPGTAFQRHKSQISLNQLSNHNLSKEQQQQLANQSVLKQQVQMQSLFEFKTKEDIINQFAISTNIQGGMLSPLSSYQIVQQKYGSTQYRPRSAQHKQNFFQNNNNNQKKQNNNSQQQQQLLQQQQKYNRQVKNNSNVQMGITGIKYIQEEQQQHQQQYYQQYSSNQQQQQEYDQYYEMGQQYGYN